MKQQQTDDLVTQVQSVSVVNACMAKGEDFIRWGIYGWKQGAVCEAFESVITLQIQDLL